MVKEWGGTWAVAHRWKHRHLSECWTNESHIIPAQLEEECWCEHFNFLCLWFPWPRETVLKQTHWMPLITVVSALEGKKMRNSVLSQKDLEHFGGNSIVPRKGKEALSDPQVCIVSQNLAWCLWQVGGNEVHLMRKTLKKARNVKNKDHRSWGRKETKMTQRIPFQRKTS